MFKIPEIHVEVFNLFKRRREDVLTMNKSVRNFMDDNSNDFS